MAQTGGEDVIRSDEEASRASQHIVIGGRALEARNLLGDCSRRNTQI
jgi:hypothetical protein